jgi:hypothetical protein
MELWARECAEMAEEAVWGTARLPRRINAKKSAENTTSLWYKP